MSDLLLEISPGALGLYELREDGKTKFLDFGRTPALEDAIAWLQERVPDLEIDEEALGKVTEGVDHG